MSQRTGCWRASLTKLVVLAAAICWSLSCTSRAVLLPPDGQPDKNEDGAVQGDVQGDETDQGLQWPAGSPGGPCDTSHPCEGSATCEGGEQYPEGFCLLVCSGPEGCPDGFACVGVKADTGDAEGWCLGLCESTDQCRPNFTCSSHTLWGSEQSVMVCR